MNRIMETTRGESSAGSGLESTVPARSRAGFSAFRQTLRIAALTGATGLAIFLFGVLGTPSANAAPAAPSATTSAQSDGGKQFDAGLLRMAGGTLQGTLRAVDATVEALLAPAHTMPPTAPIIPASRVMTQPAPPVPSNAPVTALAGPVTNVVKSADSGLQARLGGLVKTLTNPLNLRANPGTLLPVIEKLSLGGGVVSPLLHASTPTVGNSLPALASGVPLFKELIGPLTDQNAAILPTNRPPVQPAGQPSSDARPAIVALGGAKSRLTSAPDQTVLALPISSSVLPTDALGTPTPPMIGGLASTTFRTGDIKEAASGGSGTEQHLTLQRIAPTTALAGGSSAAGSGNSSAASGGGTAATTTDNFAMPPSVLSAKMGAPAFILPEALAYDPGSSPD